MRTTSGSEATFGELIYGYDARGYEDTSFWKKYGLPAIEYCYDLSLKFLPYLIVAASRSLVCTNAIYLLIVVLYWNHYGRYSLFFGSLLLASVGFALIANTLLPSNQKSEG